MSVGRAEVVVFPRIAGTVVEHCRKYTVGSTLWEGGARRCHSGFRPWSRGDCAGRPAVSG